MKTNLTILLVIIITIFTITPLIGSTQTTPVIGGVGISGSFYTYNNIRIPQGGVLNTTEMYIVVYNYINKPILLNLTYHSPKFIKIYFINIKNTTFTLAPGEHKRITVAIKVAPNAIPGTYRVAITAQRIFREKPGGPIIIQPSATQEINIRVVGEYSLVTIIALDPAGKIARNALIRLYKMQGKELVPLIDSWGGILRAKVLPGKYLAKAYLSGEKVAEANFTLKPYENKTIKLHLRIIYIEYFSVKPVLANNNLVAAHLHFIIKNVYKNLKNVSIILEVKRNGQLLEKRTLVRSSTLVLGRNEYEFDYVSTTGWKPGNYTFTIKVYGLGGKLLAESPQRWMYIKQGALSTKTIIILIIIISLLIIAAITLTRKRRKKKIN